MWSCWHDIRWLVKLIAKLSGSFEVNPSNSTSSVRLLDYSLNWLLKWFDMSRMYWWWSQQTGSCPIWKTFHNYQKEEDQDVLLYLRKALLNHHKEGDMMGSEHKQSAMGTSTAAILSEHFFSSCHHHTLTKLTEPWCHLQRVSHALRAAPSRPFPSFGKVFYRAPPPPWNKISPYACLPIALRLRIGFERTQPKKPVPLPDLSHLLMEVSERENFSCGTTSNQLLTGTNQ